MGETLDLRCCSCTFQSEKIFGHLDTLNQKEIPQSLGPAGQAVLGPGRTVNELLVGRQVLVERE